MKAKSTKNDVISDLMSSVIFTFFTTAYFFIHCLNHKLFFSCASQLLIHEYDDDDDDDDDVQLSRTRNCPLTMESRAMLQNFGRCCEILWHCRT